MPRGYTFSCVCTGGAQYQLSLSVMKRLQYFQSYAFQYNLAHLFLYSPLPFFLPSICLPFFLYSLPLPFTPTVLFSFLPFFFFLLPSFLISSSSALPWLALPLPWPAKKRSGLASGGAAPDSIISRLR